jgi:uncharacterized protein (TIGR03083 family)
MAIGMQETIDLVNRSAAKLQDYLSGLEQSQWAADSSCEGWAVADVVAHLASGAGTWTNSLARAVDGDSGPPPGQSFLGRGETGSGIIAQAATSYREEAGQGLLDNYISGYAGLSDQMSRLREEDWGKPCFHRRGNMRVGDYVALRVQELAVHSWDIRWGLEPGAEVWEEPLELMVDRVPRWLTNAFQPGLDLPAPVRYRFEVAGPAPVHEDILVNGDSFENEKNAAGQADALFRCDTGNYILLIYGRLEVNQAITDGRLDVEGDKTQAGNFTVWFKGF